MDLNNRIFPSELPKIIECYFRVNKYKPFIPFGLRTLRVGNVSILKGSLGHKKVFFLGIGGIGMSALARYFKQEDWEVCGYDKTQSPLTEALEFEGISIIYADLKSNIPSHFLNDNEAVLWVYTPAIPASSEILNISNITWLKRSEVLGLISRDTSCLAVAGTHGKTTTSILLAHILNEAGINFTAFLGGISSNLKSNYFHKSDGKCLLSKPITVMEADEYDRSFHRLTPHKAIITSSDVDHLDIYKTEHEFKRAFELFAHSVETEVFASVKVDIPLPAKTFRYKVSPEADIFASVTTSKDGKMIFDYSSQTQTIKNIEMGVPGLHNLENSLAAMSMALSVGAEPQHVKRAIENFKGVKRRFEIIIKTKNQVVIDDYAHHPYELESFINAVRGIYPGRKVTGVFQPHLFSRTKDFASDFATSLALVDDLILLDIYPAREEPLDGISSEWLLEKVALNHKQLLSKIDTLNHIENTKPELLLIMGAGDIDRLVPKIKEIYEAKTA